MTGISYAAKIIKKSALIKPRSRQKLMNEIKIHRTLNHNNIVKFEHYFEDNENVYIILNLCVNKSMSEMLKRRKRLSEFEGRCFAR